MKFPMITLVALTGLGLLTGFLALLAFRSGRGSRLYRWKIALLGFIISVWGGGVAGGNLGCETACYAGPPQDANDAQEEIATDKVDSETEAADQTMEPEEEPEE